MSKTNATFRAYLAGLFDSRGHMSISPKGNGRMYFRVHVPRRAVVSLAKEVYGGSIWRSKWYDTGANWCWETSNRETVARVIEDIYPFSQQTVALSLALQFLKGRVQLEDARGALKEFYRHTWYNPKTEGEQS